ncbi:MAG TPA: response regulator transcription factor, partial [Pseudonocardia sp.]
MNLSQPPGSGPRLLLVEDDPELVGMLAALFDEEGYQVDTATDGQRGLHLGLTHCYDVLLLDRGLPALEGLDLLSTLRRRGVSTPALVLSALGAPADRVTGLDAGAEDYLGKPFDIDELLARLRALRRRHLDTARELPVGTRRLNLDTREVSATPEAAPVRLSARECDLLATLAARPRQVFTREDLLARIFTEADNTVVVDTYVHYLRRKLGRD